MKVSTPSSGSKISQARNQSIAGGYGLHDAIFQKMAIFKPNNVSQNNDFELYLVASLFRLCIVQKITQP
jgi:hypothetical protein